MEKIMGELFARGVVLPNAEFSLSQPDADSFSAFIEPEKYHDFFTDLIFCLSGHYGGQAVHCAATVDNCERVGGQVSLPDLAYFEADSCDDVAIGIFQACLALNRAVQDEFSALRQILNRERHHDRRVN